MNMSKQNPKELVVTCRKVDLAVVVVLSGSANVVQAGKIQKQLTELAGEHAPLIVLDMCELEFIGSQGLGEIVAGHLRGRHHHGRIRIAAPQPAIRKLLDTTRLSDLFPIFESVDEALKG